MEAWPAKNFKTWTLLPAATNLAFTLQHTTSVPLRWRAQDVAWTRPLGSCPYQVLQTSINTTTAVAVNIQVTGPYDAAAAASAAVDEAAAEQATGTADAESPEAEAEVPAAAGIHLERAKKQRKDRAEKHNKLIFA